MPDAPARRRTITWTDPSVYLARPELSGLQMMQAMLTGDLPRPPVGELMDMRPVEVERGRIVFALDVAECFYSPLNFVHGGVTALLLDTVMGCAVQTLLPAGGGYSTTDLQVRYVRPVTVASGTLRAEGRVVHAGSRVVTAEGKAFDARGKLVAHGSCGCLLLDASRRQTPNA